MTVVICLFRAFLSVRVVRCCGIGAEPFVFAGCLIMDYNLFWSVPCFLMCFDVIWVS